MYWPFPIFIGSILALLFGTRKVLNGICWEMSKRLDELKTGNSGRIVCIQGDDAVAVRLMEMGLTEGESIRRVGESPFGDPIEFSVCGYRLVLRASEAARVQVEELS